MTIKFREPSNKQDIYIPPMHEEEPELEQIPIPEVSKEQKELMDLQELLSEVDPKGAPMLSVLEAWKGRHRSLYVSKVSSSSEQYYVFTTIKRNDFKLLKEQGVFDDEEKGYEVLVEKCLLYPQPTTAWRLTSDAGIITTLGKQISYKSGFVGPQEALSLIKIV